MGHTATLLPDGRVLIAGGSVSASQGFVPSNGAEIYDPSTGIFSATGKMVGNHGCQQAILLNNGKVLIVGGNSNGQPPNAELYDPATGTFAPTGTYASDTFDFNTCQGSQSALLADGRVLIVFESGDAELYDPSRDAFTRTDNPIAADYVDGLPTATLLMSGDVLVAGGAEYGLYTNAELFNLATETFTTTANMTSRPDARYRDLAPRRQCLDDRQLFARQWISRQRGTLRSDCGGISSTGEMTTTRSLHTATLLNNGRVLIAGGSTYGGALLTPPPAELYTPNVLAPAPKLLVAASGGTVQGAIWHASSGELASPDSPAVAGDILSMYTTSLGDGGLIPPQVAIGGLLAGILYFGPAPGYPGYSQVNFRVPADVAAGAGVPVRLMYLGRSSNAVTIGVQ